MQAAWSPFGQHYKIAMSGALSQVSASPGVILDVAGT